MASSLSWSHATSFLYELFRFNALSRHPLFVVVFNWSSRIANEPRFLYQVRRLLEPDWISHYVFQLPIAHYPAHRLISLCEDFTISYTRRARVSPFVRSKTKNMHLLDAHGASNLTATFEWALWASEEEQRTDRKGG